jgi:dolichol-phosphate mannosyltransferase
MSRDSGPMLSVVIPAHNEHSSIESVLSTVCGRLETASIPYEVVVVDDHSTDATRETVEAVAAHLPRVRCIANPNANGYGLAVRAGLDVYQGDIVAIMMGDGSDSADDLVSYYEHARDGAECVFGSRFIRGSRVVDYPPVKLVINRLANQFIRVLFGIPLNDTTNAFKCYRREVIDGVRPLLSKHFNLTVELPLKAVTRGFGFTVIPISWHGRATGLSKLKLKEMGSRYLFIVLYVWLERLLSKGDYHRPVS